MKPAPLRVLNDVFGCRGAPRFAWQAAVRPYQKQSTTLNWLQRAIAAKSHRSDSGSDGDLARFSTPSLTLNTSVALQRQIDATDRQIDRLVYELYGLTEEEIGIVEGAKG